MPVFWTGEEEIELRGRKAAKTRAEVKIGGKMIIRLILLLALASIALGIDTPCVWQSPSGAVFDLRALTVASATAKSYYILDGDIPCTPETEPAFSYTWNFCADVTDASLPGVCRNMGKKGVALQYLQLESFSDCYIIGKYDPARDVLHYGLLVADDPSKGVLLTYPTGERCASDPKGALRSTAIELQCANSPTTVVSAQSPSSCQYRLVMKSYYACPTQCPVTDNGLCNSHGHCAFDAKSGSTYCYCNEGFYGAACASTTSDEAVVKAYDGRSVQIGLLVTLLIVLLVLVAVVGAMAYKIQQFRKEAAYDQLSSSSSHGLEQEMVEQVRF